MDVEYSQDTIEDASDIPVDVVPNLIASGSTCVEQWKKASGSKKSDSDASCESLRLRMKEGTTHSRLYSSRDALHTFPNESCARRVDILELFVVGVAEKQLSQQSKESDSSACRESLMYCEAME